jgi:hypothetical protein
MDFRNYLLRHLCLAKETVANFEDPGVICAVVPEYYNTVFAFNMSEF